MTASMLRLSRVGPRSMSFLLVLLLLVASCNTISQAEEAAAAATSNTTPKPLQQPEQWQNDLVQWLISKPNGYFSDKVLWTKTEMGYNMHAADDIPKGETIMIIPPGAVINSDGTDEECVTIHKMMKEYEKGPGSDYYPYIRYLFGGHEGGTSAGLLPSTWSQPAKALLKTILGSDLYPRNFEKGQRKVLSFCKDYIDAEDIQNIDQETHQRWQDAYIFWLSRSWTDKMVPILDMINHRNGKWLNVESTTAHSGEDIRVYALRDIAKGEQLWNTYNECLDSDCDGGRIKYTYITQHILADYGFVEAYPRRFIFNVDESGTRKHKDEYLTVEIDDDPGNSGTHTLEWHYQTPTELQLKWISFQLERLESLVDVVTEGLAELTSEHEKNTIETYYRAYMEAFQLALVHKEDKVSTRTTIFDDDEDGDEL